MKQHLTTDQIAKMNGKSQIAYFGYCETKGIQGDVPKLNIGEMIEFLGMKDYGIVEIIRFMAEWGIQITTEGKVYAYGPQPELCDALWEACKPIFEGGDIP